MTMSSIPALECLTAIPSPTYLRLPHFDHLHVSLSYQPPVDLKDFTVHHFKPMACTLQKPNSRAIQLFTNIWTLSSVFLLENNANTSTQCCCYFSCIFTLSLYLSVQCSLEKEFDSLIHMKKSLP